MALCAAGPWTARFANELERMVSDGGSHRELIVRARRSLTRATNALDVPVLLEHWLARKRSLKWINTAFFRLNALISIVFLVIVLAEVLFPFNFGR